MPHGREVAVDATFALVVTHSCEIDRQKDADVAADHFDCRLTVAPIVPEPAVTLVGQMGDVQTVHWAAIEANDPVASLFLPPNFTWRDLARHEVLEGMVGRRIAAAIALGPRGERWRVALIADDGTSATVEVRLR